MRLLISVAAAAEVAAALEGGADVVDIKQPSEGSLGAPQPALIRRVRPYVAPPVELSVAIGDAPHLPGTFALAALGAAGCGVDYVKVGVLGSKRAPEAVALLSAVRRAALEGNPRTRVLAVAYADAARVGAPPPHSLPDIARDSGIEGVVLDTNIKDGTSVFAALGESAIAAFLDAARNADLLTGLAGSLSAGDLSRLRRLGPDLVGVRGAACEGGRTGRVSALRVRGLRAALGLSVPASPLSAHTRAAPAIAQDGGR